MRQLQHGDKRRFKRRLVLATKRADRIVIGMQVGAEEAHGHITVRGGLDRARAEPSGGVAIDEQGEHHRGRILFTACAAMVHMEVAGGNLLNSIEDQVDQMICGQPLAQVTGQKQRRLPIHINKTFSHTGLDPFHALLFNSFSKNFHA